MVESGDYLTPRYNYANRFQKPVLYYWGAALALRGRPASAKPRLGCLRRCRASGSRCSPGRSAAATSASPRDGSRGSCSARASASSRSRGSRSRTCRWPSSSRSGRGPRCARCSTASVSIRGGCSPSAARDRRGVPHEGARRRRGAARRAAAARHRRAPLAGAAPARSRSRSPPGRVRGHRRAVVLGDVPRARGRVPAELLRRRQSRALCDRPFQRPAPALVLPAGRRRGHAAVEPVLRALGRPRVAGASRGRGAARAGATCA